MPWSAMTGTIGGAATPDGMQASANGPNIVSGTLAALVATPVGVPRVSVTSLTVTLTPQRVGQTQALPSLASVNVASSNTSLISRRPAAVGSAAETADRAIAPT